MIITRYFGSTAPGFDTTHKSAAGQNPLAHWRQDNAVLCANTRRAEYPPIVSPLSIKSISHGTASILLGGRRVVLDDDHYQVFNVGDVYSTSIQSERPIHAFCVYFRPGIEEEVAAGLRHDARTALDRGHVSDRIPVSFCGHVRHHDELVTPALREIRANVLAGRIDDDWYEEAFQDLLGRLFNADKLHRRLADRLGSIKLSTREELLRRIGWATDYINSSYMDQITLDDIACAASLSKFHLARLFKQALGLTPHSFLQRKRTQVARRLLDTTDLDLSEVALAAGFGSRWTMYRFLRRSFGGGGRQLRGALLTA